LNISSGEALNRLLVPELPQPASASAKLNPAALAAATRIALSLPRTSGSMIAETGFDEVYTKASVAGPRQG
jgi:hypothetical protein